MQEHLGISTIQGAQSMDITPAGTTKAAQAWNDQQRQLPKSKNMAARVLLAWGEFVYLAPSRWYTAVMVMSYTALTKCCFGPQESRLSRSAFLPL